MTFPANDVLFWAALIFCMKNGQSGITKISAEETEERALSSRRIRIERSCLGLLMEEGKLSDDGSGCDDLLVYGKYFRKMFEGVGASLEKLTVPECMQILHAHSVAKPDFLTKYNLIKAALIDYMIDDGLIVDEAQFDEEQHNWGLLVFVFGSLDQVGRFAGIENKAADPQVDEIRGGFAANVANCAMQ